MLGCCGPASARRWYGAAAVSSRGRECQGGGHQTGGSPGAASARPVREVLTTHVAMWVGFTGGDARRKQRLVEEGSKIHK